MGREGENKTILPNFDDNENFPAYDDSKFINPSSVFGMSDRLTHAHKYLTVVIGLGSNPLLLYESDLLCFRVTGVKCIPVFCCSFIPTRYLS